MATKKLLVGLLAIFIATSAVADDKSADARSAEVKAWTKSNLEKLLELYRTFHTTPEISLHEKETSARVAAEWKAAGFDVTTGIGGYGVVAILKNGDGPRIMLRTDLDALPVEEKTGLVYASKVKIKDASGLEVGVMHACGHDIHMTNLVAVARYLGTHRDQWQGTLMLIGQPAEERVLGAKAMLEDGLFTRFPKPDLAFALHVDSALAAGKLGVRGGYALANTDAVDITVNGKGGHGAYPHATNDPIVQAAQLVLALQTIVSREIKPTEPSVITVGSIHGGTKHNIIGDSCHLQLTVRSYSDEVREQMMKAIERKAKGIAASMGAPDPVIKISEGTPALFNDEKLASRVDGIFRRIFGSDKIEMAEQSMGGEDFSRYGKAGVPILMYRLGSVDAKRLERYAQLGQNPPSLHSPLYYPDAELTLETGVVSMTNVVLEFMKPK